MSNEKTRIGLIGTGMIGAAHTMFLKQAIALPGINAELAAACDTDEKRGREFAKNFGYKHYFTDPFELIKSGEVNALFVCTPTKYHADLVKEGAAKKLDIFCEKPLAVNLDIAREMEQSVIEASIKHQVGLVLRRSPTLAVLKHFMDNTDTGKLITVVFRDDQGFPIKGFHPSTWRKDVEEAGGGTLIEHSIHDLDLLMWYFGKPTSVQATTRNNYGYTGIEDLAIVKLTFESGAIANLISIWHDIHQRSSNRLLEIFFEKAYFSAEDRFIGDIYYQLGEGKMKIIKSREIVGRMKDALNITDPDEIKVAGSLYGLQDYLFLKSIRDDETAFPGFDVAVKAHEVVELAYRSAKEGSEIEL